MNSRTVYYEEPYLKTLEATVVAITEEGVILDRTICYPEGGGQSGDRGTIGGCTLLDTVKGEEGTILHKVDNPTFSVGEQVLVVLDWAHRYHYMQMHTAQHVASGLLHSHFGIGTVSVHQGEKILTIETDQGEIPASTCFALEELVNQSVREAHPLSYREEAHEDAMKLKLRRSIKVDNDTIRLVVIEDVDMTACGGLHLANTSEVILFQYEGQEKLRGHVRLIFSVGQEALAMIRENRSLVAQLCTLHSAQRENLLEVERQLLSQIAQDRTQLLKKSEQVAELTLFSLMEKAEQIGGIPLVLWEVGEDIDLKHVGTACAHAGDLALCAAKQEEGKLIWLIGLGGKASALLDFNRSRNRLLAPIEGKGGGRDTLFQGVGKGKPETLFSVFKELLYEHH
ncbi:alanine--tRNA ligase-related protein [Sphaerochaeta sp. PS]|uniref:alanyl-tRNA editing protein n=1 Tax=Sphaerochaeta sp. PS TaxID=3076336 RepID=UPI0028A357B4|nr:alanine--tRNA ligase-related protein [Sphaerochaeta sp. PS]MDT4762558.1 alanine--tRNA ligase-related protein [Sphaerochaeta sp. PS]